MRGASRATPHRNGYFTVALAEGLSGKADTNGDGVVHYNEFDTYVSQRVKDLTAGRQHPVMAKPATIRPFPIADQLP